MKKRSAERSYDAPGKVLARLAATRPRIAYPLASAVGAFRNRVTRRWPSTAEVHALFPLLTRAATRHVASAIGALEERNRVLVRSIRRDGIEPVRGLVSAPASLLSLRGPCILITFHVGALHALGAALEQFETPVLSFRHGALFTPTGALVVQSTEGGEQQRAMAFHRALLHLRDGGIVVIPLDVTEGPSIPMPCLGHTLRLAPGAFALAKATRAPMIPIVAQWTRTGISMLSGESLPQPTPEATAAWLESYLLASPSEITLGLVRSLLYL